MSKKMRTDIKNVRGLGASGSGTEHFVHQRSTSVLLIFLVAWFVISMICLFSGNETPELFYFIRSPYNVMAMLCFIIFGIYHGCLGMQVVIEDYVSCMCLRRAMIFLLRFVSFISILAAVLSIFNAHAVVSCCESIGIV